MKKALVYLFLFVSNIGVFIFLLIVNQFVQFFLYGSGASSGDHDFEWITFFALIQIMTLALLYYKHVLIKEKLLLIFTVATIALLYAYVAVYLPATTVY